MNNNEYVYLIFHHDKGYDTYSSWHTIKLVIIVNSEDSAKTYIKENNRGYGYYEYKKIKMNEECDVDLSEAYR